MRRKKGELIPLEIEILEAAMDLQREGVLAFHGYSLAKSMKSRSDGRMLTAHGTLYRALHRLARAGEQLFAHELFQIGDPARERGGAKPDFLGRGARGTKANSTHKSFERPQGWQTT